MSQTYYAAKRKDGHAIQAGLSNFPAARTLAKNAGEGAFVEARNWDTGVTWKVGEWSQVGSRLKWVQVGPRS